MEIRITEGANKGGSDVRFDIRMRSRDFGLYFRSSCGILAGNTEAALACALLPAMREASPVGVHGATSKKLLNALSAIQDIYRVWDPSLKRVDMKGACPVDKAEANGERVGAFFSGGIDSFYTAIKHRGEITDLIFVHGFDIPLDNEALRTRTSNAIREVGEHFGKRVVEVETNLKSFLKPHVRWGLFGHGAALATIGLLLSSSFRRIYVPATHTYADLFPWGSHPLLDPLWSTECREFVHDGCEAGRIEKVAVVATSEVALRTLRVCWKNPNSAYNCGSCEKCIRTMTNLRAVGALDRCTTFDKPLEIGDVLKIRVLDENTRAFVAENLKALAERECDQELQLAFRRVLRRSTLDRSLDQMKRSVVRVYPVKTAVNWLRTRQS